MLTWDFCQSQSTSGSSLLLGYCSLNLFWYGHWSPFPIVVSLGLYSLFLHHCESTPKSILLFKTFLLRLFGSQTSEFGRSPWEKLEVFWGHSDFQPCAKNSSGFSHSAQVKPESGACPLAKINKCLQRKRSYRRLVHFSSVFLQNLNPCNPLRCLYTNDFQKNKKVCGLLLQGLSVISGRLSMSQAKSQPMGKSNRCINETRETWTDRLW